MAITAICGRTASVTVGGSAYSAHQFTLEVTSNEIDTTGFSSGPYGDLIACTRHGSLAVSCYEMPAVAVGDTVAWAGTLPYSSPVTLSGNGVVVSRGVGVDAKGIVEHHLSIRVTGDITGF